LERRVIVALVLGTLIAIATLACVTVAVFYTPIVGVGAQQAKTVRVFHAGSLAVPLAEAESQFEALHPNMDVQRESMGSVKAIRQITDVGKRADVLASADYSLIPGMMYPEYADWYVRFATNDMVLAYNPDKSKYAAEITPNNWYEILRKEGVVFGFSNPNLDPCGYRSLMVMQLAELHYKDSRIFDDLVLNNTAITISEDADGTFLMTVPEDPKPNTEKVDIRPKSVELVAFVEEGGLDYAFEYRSVAVQHNLAFVDLPEQIDLSRIEYADTYKKMKVQTADGAKTGKPIVYGITVPKNAENPDMGLEFVKFVIGDAGQNIFADMGQPPIVPPEGSGNVPEELKALMQLEPVEPMPTPTPAPAPKEPGFEAGFVIAGILAIVYLTLRMRKVYERK